MENSFVAQKSSALVEHCRAEVYTMERGSVFWRLFRPYVHVSFHILESGAERVIVLKLSAVCPNKYLKSRDEEFSQSVGNTRAVRLSPWISTIANPVYYPYLTLVNPFQTGCIFRCLQGGLLLRAADAEDAHLIWRFLLTFCIWCHFPFYLTAMGISR